MLDNLEYHINQVLLFNRICGTEKRLEKEREAVIELYENLTLEELNETIKAISNLDKVEVADGLVDQFYVGVYWSYCVIKEDILTLFKNNGCTDSFLREPTYPLGLISKAWKVFGDVSKTHLFVLEIIRYINTQNKKWDMERVMNEVHKSNFSKFIDVTDMDLNSLEDLQKKESEWIYNSYREQGKDLDCVVCEVVETEGKQWLVFKNGKGKVLKPSTFISPNLKFVEMCNA